jgi:hypothetical protein
MHNLYNDFPVTQMNKSVQEGSLSAPSIGSSPASAFAANGAWVFPGKGRVRHVSVVFYIPESNAGAVIFRIERDPAIERQAAGCA